MRDHRARDPLHPEIRADGAAAGRHQCGAGSGAPACQCRASGHRRRSRRAHAQGTKLLVQLAETLQAPVIDQGGRMNIPNTHYLNQTARTAALIGNADVIIGLELSDYWARSTTSSTTAPTASAYNETKHQAGHQADRHQLDGAWSPSRTTRTSSASRPLDVDMAGDAEATLPALIEAVKSAIRSDRKAALEKRGDDLKKAYADARDRTRAAAAVAWDASPISHRAHVRWKFTARSRTSTSRWCRVPAMSAAGPTGCGAWRSTTTGSAGSGGSGVGYGSPPQSARRLATATSAAVSPSASRATATSCMRLACCGRRRGTRSRSSRVMHNNRGYHQEVMHVQRLANRRNRVATLGMDRSPIGTSIENPDIDYASLAKSMGYWSAGPIKDPAELGPTLKRAVRGRQGRPAGADRRVDAAAVNEDTHDRSSSHNFWSGWRHSPPASLWSAGRRRRGLGRERQAEFLKNGCWQCHGERGQGASASQARAGPDPVRDVADLRADDQPATCRLPSRTDPVE